MNDINATELDDATLDPAMDNQPVSEDGAETASASTVETDTSSGANDDSLTNQDSSDSTESAMERFDAQLRNRNQSPDQTVTQPTPDVNALTLEQVQETLGIKSPEDLKRYQHQTSLFGRQANELGQLRQELAKLQQANQEEAKRREEEAQRLNLSPFHAGHPQYQDNQRRIANARAFKASLRAAPPEMQQDPQYRARLAAEHRVSNQDLDLADQQDSYREAQTNELYADPERYIESRAMRVIDQRLQAYDQYLNQRQAAQSFVQQHQQLVSDPAAQQIMSRVLDPSVSRSDIAVQLAQITKQRDELLAKAEKNTSEVETLRAQQELATRQTQTRRRASVSTTTQIDPWKSYNDQKSDPKAQDKLLDQLYGAH